MRRMLVAVVLSTLTAGCGPFSDGIGGSSDEIADAVEEAGASGKPFRLADVTDFEWDRFHVLGAYVSNKVADKQLGFRWARRRTATTA